MRNRMKVIAVMFGLSAAALSMAARADDCDSTQASMNECASKQYAALDAELNKQYKAQMSYLKSPGEKKALQEAQKKWIAFRDADCLYQVGRREDSGTIWPMEQAMCLADQTRVRVEQLKKFVACRQEGCPR
jgi:uncharacterized protein YecT (DUF1311 family)